MTRSKHPIVEFLEVTMTADYSAGYTDAALGLGFHNPKQSPEYEDGYNQALIDRKYLVDATGNKP